MSAVYHMIGLEALAMDSGLKLLSWTEFYVDAIARDRDQYYLLDKGFIVHIRLTNIN